MRRREGERANPGIVGDGIALLGPALPLDSTERNVCHHRTPRQHFHAQQNAECTHLQHVIKQRKKKKKEKKKEAGDLQNFCVGTDMRTNKQAQP